MNKEFKALSEWEKEIIFNLSVVPNTFFSIPRLMAMLQISNNSQFSFFDTIHDLSIKGFLTRKKDKYSVNQEYYASIVCDFKPSSEDCSLIINYFLTALEKKKLEYNTTFLSILTNIQSILNRITGNSLLLAQLSYMLSASMIKFGKYEQALKYNKFALQISESVDQKHPVVALFYRDKALIYKKLGNTQKAIHCSLKDIEILEYHDGKYDDLLPDSYFTLSKTYEDVKEYSKAVEYNLKALKYEKKQKSEKSINISGLYHNLAYCYMKLNNLRSASLFINKAVDSYDKENIPNHAQHKHLLRDQKRFNSLFILEQFVKKNRNILLIIGIISVIAFVSAIIGLLYNTV